MFYFMTKRPWKCRVVYFTFGTYVADQRELKRSLSRWSDDSFMTLILTWPTSTDVEQITHWFISPDMCFLQHASYQCSSYLIQLPAYNTIFLLGQSAQHLQLSDPTLASMTLFYMLVYCGGANKLTNCSLMVITYLKTICHKERRKWNKCLLGQKFSCAIKGVLDCKKNCHKTRTKISISLSVFLR